MFLKDFELYELKFDTSSEVTLLFQKVIKINFFWWYWAYGVVKVCSYNLGLISSLILFKFQNKFLPKKNTLPSLMLKKEC